MFFMKRRAGLRGELGMAEEPQPRTPARAGSAAAPLPRDGPGEPGMLCPGVLVWSYESITIQDHPHPSNAAWLSSHGQL